MMTTLRLYYDDPYQREFEARVVERIEVGGRPAVILDRTCFYPTSGGQPHDTGALNGVAVVDVMERPADGAVVHVLDGELGGLAVRGQIDRARRFDLMQQHTGQHILSQAGAEVLGAETVSFHLGQSASTVDLDRAPLALAEVDEALALANRVVFDDRPVRARFVTPEELARLPLRKRPAVSGPIRVVEVTGFDRSACGGTHCRATGEVGPIAVTRVERRGGQTRLEFLCGGRAVADYREKHQLLSALAGRFKAHLVFARAADLDLDVSALLEDAGRLVGGGGGGRPNLAQGGGPRADKVEEALALAVERLAAAGL